MNKLKNNQASDSASADAELTAPSGIAEPILHCMGLKINRNSLYRKDELMAILNKYGAFDSTLDKVRDTYTERFGNHLIWKYPFSDNMQGGGTIIPVQEGFVFLPYNCVNEREGARYQLHGAELLSAESIRTLQYECRTYVEGLLAALGDMERTMPVCSARRYVDAQGNLYFVRGGLGGVFKGFRRYADPKPGQRRESGIRSLPYVADFCQAQLDLDQYARKHRPCQLEAGEDRHL